MKVVTFQVLLIIHELMTFSVATCKERQDKEYLGLHKRKRLQIMVKSHQK